MKEIVNKNALKRFLKLHYRHTILFGGTLVTLSPVHLKLLHNLKIKRFETFLKAQVRLIRTVNDVEVDIEGDDGKVIGAEERGSNRVPLADVAGTIENENIVLVQVQV